MVLEVEMQMKKSALVLLLENDKAERFFTKKSNLGILLEFIRTFKLKACLVRAENVTLLELPDLSKRISENNPQNDVQYSIVKQVYPPTDTPQIVTAMVKSIPTMESALLKEADQDVSKKELRQEIREYIENMFNNYEVVAIGKIQIKYPTIKKSTIYNNLHFVRKKLEFQGAKIRKVSVGMYQIEKPKDDLEL